MTFNIPHRLDPCPCGSGQKFKVCCGKLKELALQKYLDTQPLLTNARSAVHFGDFKQAEQYFRQYLTVNPQHAEALAGIGQCLCWQQQHSDGILYLKLAARQLQQDVFDSGQVRPLIDLGTQLMHWGEVETALLLAEAGVKIAPKNAATLNFLALCLSRMNRNAEALPYAQQACLILPHDAGCHILLAILETRQGQFSAAQNRLQQVISTCHDAEQKARAYLELGITLDKLGDFEQAFAAFTQSSLLQCQLSTIQALSKQTIFTAITEERAGFNAALLQRWTVQDFALDGFPIPIFLFGFLRSGTTLTEQVLAAHPDLVTSNEEPFIAELIAELRRYTAIEGSIVTALRQLSLEDARYLRGFYWKSVATKYGEQLATKRFVDKLALNTIEAGLISTLFPDAKIIFALRDPRDVCLSCYMQAFTLTATTVNLISLKGIVRQYAAVMDHWLALRECLAPAIMTLRYEETVNAFDATYRRLFEFLEVAWNPESHKFYTTASTRYVSTPSFSAVSQPLYKTAVGRWRHYLQNLGEVLPQLQRYVEAFGYET